MKMIRQHIFFFSLCGLLTFLYLTRGIFLPSDFNWPGVNNMKANVLDVIYSNRDVDIPENIELNEVDFNSNIQGCDFHIYDKLGNIHCSSTYDNHVENIKRYLK